MKHASLAISHQDCQHCQQQHHGSRRRQQCEVLSHQGVLGNRACTAVLRVACVIAGHTAQPSNHSQHRHPAHLTLRPQELQFFSRHLAEVSITIVKPVPVWKLVAWRSGTFVLGPVAGISVSDLQHQTAMYPATYVRARRDNFAPGSRLGVVA